MVTFIHIYKNTSNKFDKASVNQFNTIFIVQLNMIYSLLVTVQVYNRLVTFTIEQDHYISAEMYTKYFTFIYLKNQKVFYKNVLSNKYYIHIYFIQLLMSRRHKFFIPHIHIPTIHLLWTNNVLLRPVHKGYEKGPYQK